MLLTWAHANQGSWLHIQIGSNYTYLLLFPDQLSNTCAHMCMHKSTHCALIKACFIEYQPSALGISYCLHCVGRASYCETGRKCCLLEMLPTHSSTPPGNSNRSAYIMYMYDLTAAIVIPAHNSTLRLPVCCVVLLLCVCSLSALCLTAVVD